MSRLHNPGPGEILDRLTILALKITYGRMARRPTQHWEEEQADLYVAVRKVFHDAGMTGPQDLTLLELAAVNAALWQAEDELRQLAAERTSGRWCQDEHAKLVSQAGHVGFKIQRLNDRRAELVTLINANAGVDRPPDKL